jgi:hypothetical protein
LARPHILAALGLAAVSIAALTAPAWSPASAQPAAPPPPASHHNECFARSDINGFEAPNDRTVYIRVGVRDVWRLDLMSECVGLTFHQGFALESQPNDAFVCDPLGETVIIREGGIPQRCPVTAITKLTPDQVAALPKKDRP